MTEVLKLVTSVAQRTELQVQRANDAEQESMGTAHSRAACTTSPSACPTVSHQLGAVLHAGLGSRVSIVGEALYARGFQERPHCAKTCVSFQPSAIRGARGEHVS